MSESSTPQQLPADGSSRSGQATPKETVRGEDSNAAVDSGVLGSVGLFLKSLTFGDSGGTPVDKRRKASNGTTDAASIAYDSPASPTSPGENLLSRRKHRSTSSELPESQSMFSLPSFPMNLGSLLGLRSAAVDNESATETPKTATLLGAPFSQNGSVTPYDEGNNNLQLEDVEGQSAVVNDTAPPTPTHSPMGRPSYTPLPSPANERPRLSLIGISRRPSTMESPSSTEFRKAEAASRYCLTSQIDRNCVNSCA